MYLYFNLSCFCKFFIKIYYESNFFNPDYFYPKNLRYSFRNIFYIFRLSFGDNDYEDRVLEQEYDEYTEYNTNLETTLPSQNKVKFEDKNLLDNYRKIWEGEKSKIDETPLESFQCSLCSKIVESKFKLTRHVRWVHEKNLKCDKCDKLFYNKIHLNKHLEVHRRRELSGRGELPKDLKDLQCEKCGNHSETARKFRQHMRTHYQFSCSDCNCRPFLTQVSYYTTFSNTG